MLDPVEKLPTPHRGWYLAFWGALSLYAAAFLIYSEVWSFAWDESYHLLAAQLILAGKKPYIDFCFPQSPLNAYWNAWWMSVWGQSWHVVHAFAALLTIGAVLLTADFFVRRFPARSWRLAGRRSSWPGGRPERQGIRLRTFGAGLRHVPVHAGAGVPDFRARRGSKWMAAAGAGRAGRRSRGRFVAPVRRGGPDLLAWMFIYNRVGSRWLKSAAFTVGTAIAFVPVFRLFSLGPRQTWFNLVQYHVIFRKLYWPETTSHDLEVLSSWIDSGQALVLGLLALFGLLYVARRSRWPRALKAEFYLCAWLSAALSAEAGRAHPTFPQYFLFIVPFVAILAGMGLYAIGSRVLEPDRPLWPVVLVTALSVFGLGQALYNRRDEVWWGKYKVLAAKINQVTPPNAKFTPTSRSTS